MRQSIAIAGCGTAGLAAAALLARDGHRVHLFERFAEPRPVGSGLLIQPTGMAILGELGLAGAALEAGARIDRLHGLAGQRTVLDVRYDALDRDDGFAVAIHRADLFDILFGAALAAGVTIEANRAVAGVDGRRFRFADGLLSSAFDLLVDATGSRSPLIPRPARALAYGALWTTVEGFEALVPTGTLSQRYRRASQMAGLLPLGRGRTALFWSLRADARPALAVAGIAAWRERWAALWPGTSAIARSVASLDALTFARYAHRTLGQPVTGRLIHIGDSWHSTSPQLGQGANQAMLDAFALARALRDERDLDRALDSVVRMRRRHVMLYQAMSLLLTPVYQSDGTILPVLRDWLVGPLSSTWPVPHLQAALVSGLVGGPLPRLGLSAAARRG